jgi:hypothetical protein
VEAPNGADAEDVTGGSTPFRDVRRGVGAHDEDGDSILTGSLRPGRPVSVLLSGRQVPAVTPMMQTPAFSLQPTDVPCAGCRTVLPPGAVFCVECGLCMLDVTRGGTVIAHVPSRTTAPPEPTLAQLRRELDIPAMSGEWVVLGDDDIDIVLDDLESDEEPDLLPLPPYERTVVTRGPVRPAPFWDAPARGDTRIGPAPTQPSR